MNSEIPQTTKIDSIKRFIRNFPSMMFTFFRERYYLLTPILWFLSFPSYDLIIFKANFLFAWIAFIPLFLYVKDKGMKQVFYVSFIAGFWGNLFSYNWIGNFGAHVPGGFFLLAFMISISMAVFITTKMFLAEYISRQFESLRFLIYPSIWISIDAVQSIGFFAFPLPFWGYTQYSFLPFIQIGSIVGIFGITFLMILFSFQLSEVIARAKTDAMKFKDLLKTIEAKRFGVFTLFITVIIIAGSIVLLVNHRGERKDMRVAIVQSCIDPWENWQLKRLDNLEELKRITTAAMDHNPDFLIWSESATLEPIAYCYERSIENEFIRRLLAFVADCNRPLLTGEIGIIEENFYKRYPQNNAVLINNLGEVVSTYSKIHLVPLGEWFPYERLFPFIQELALTFGASMFVPGDTPVLFRVKGFNFGTLICYEGMFHRLCRRYKQMGAQFFVNITNDGWTDTYSGHMQHFSVSVFRAIENGIWYVRAGNDGYTVVIDPFGREVSSIPILQNSYLIGDLDFSLNHDTIYEKVGDVILYLVLLFISLLLGIMVYRKSRKANEEKQT